MTAIRTAPHRQAHVEPLPLYLVTLIRNIKSRELFKLNNLNHTMMKTVLHRAQTGLLQCYNCQKFGQVWANSVFVRGGEHLHRKCPDKTNKIYAELLQLHPRRRKEASGSFHLKSSREVARPFKKIVVCILISTYFHTSKILKK
jgi:hypothetical protein